MNNQNFLKENNADHMRYPIAHPADSLAKAITNAYFAFGAVMLSDTLVEAFEKDNTGKAMIGHGYTCSGHPVGAAAAIACLKETERLQVHTNAAVRGEELFTGLQGLAEKYSTIGDVRGGHGLMCALELVSDRSSKQPVDKSLAIQLQQATYEAGVMVRVSGPNVILSPPLILTADDVQSIVGALDSGFSSIQQ